jgi:DNA (cytosine-5)-methyltransferase 3A
MIVLSLFDGLSAGRLALERAGIEVENYYASEIDKYAVTVSKKNWPDIIQIGDVTQVSYKDGVLYTQFGSYQTEIDMVIGGSPCQSFSVAGNGKGFDGSSGLFYEWLRILREVRPKYFLLENVCMKKEWENVITQEVGVAPIMINSALVSAQNRKRLYWTNIEGITQPQDKGILLKDILENFVFDKEPYYIVFNSNRPKNYKSDKSMCLVTSGGSKTKGVGICDDSGMWRKLTPIECERLQTLPDNYTDGVSNSQRYKMIGNGWTVDVIAHIFSFIKQEKQND